MRADGIPASVHRRITGPRGIIIAQVGFSLSGQRCIRMAAKACKAPDCRQLKRPSLFAVFLCSGNDAPAIFPPEKGQSCSECRPPALYQHSVTTDSNGFIYVFGGSVSFVLRSNQIWRYDPESGRGLEAAVRSIPTGTTAPGASFLRAQCQPADTPAALRFIPGLGTSGRTSLAVDPLVVSVYKATCFVCFSPHINILASTPRHDLLPFFFQLLSCSCSLRMTGSSQARLMLAARNPVL